MAGYVEWMLESSLLVVMVLGIRKIFMGKIRYAGIYALWLVVLVRFLIPVNFITTPFSVGAIVSETLFLQDNEKSTVLQGSGWQAEAGGKEQITSSEKESGKSQGQSIKENGEKNVLSEQGLANTQSSRRQRMGSLNWRILFLSVWGAISGLLFLWFVLSNISLTRKLKRNRILYRMREGVKIYVASGVKTPCLYGFLQPVIYLPRHLFEENSQTKVTQEELEQMITHEYVHYEHRDYIWAMFRMLLVSVYWFDPFLWLAASYSKKDAELFCDETVIRIVGEENRFCYGKMLIRLAGDGNWGEFRYPIMSMSRRGREMAKRIRAISDRKHYSRWLILPLVLIVSVAVVITCSSGIGPLARSGKPTVERVGKKSVVSGSALSSVGAGKISGQGMAEEGTKTIRSVNSAAGDTYTGENEKSAVAVSTCKKVFEQYIKIFTEAVNTGNTDKMSQVLDTGSDVYEQQCFMAKNYYKRGIREEIKSYSITQVKAISPLHIELQSKEKIRVFYEDTSSKLIKQKYFYTCEYKDNKWVITKMEDIK